MLLQLGVFGPIAAVDSPEAYHRALENAWSSFCTWRKTHKISTSQKRFRYRHIFNEEYGMYMNCKGFNARCVAEWLLNTVTDVRHRLPMAGVMSDERLVMTEACLRLSRINKHQTRRINENLHWISLLLRPFCFPRRGICRYYGLTERASRALWLGSIDMAQTC